jgi:hypothetical protein
MTIKITLHFLRPENELKVTEITFKNVTNEFVTEYIHEFHSYGFPYIEIERID